MANKTPRDLDDDTADLTNDASQLADTLEEVLKSFGSDAKEGAEEARQRAEALLKETRARLNGRGRIHQAAKDAVSSTDNFVRDKPWCSVGTAAAIGLFVGVLLGTRR
ncbi:DUF883 family protein [Shimwellia pseudoproteus]|uniref:DUF883 family protein n=1 Tax=Shimwellia pseudoproteus TaxID=570012 RepID=UPI0018ED7228|nr:DUF883 family protein [Shimwellia pseudoproteus]MBJ3816060.1 DUF883 family protein [Shimwellia pseudoproteus]